MVLSAEDEQRLNEISKEQDKVRQDIKNITRGKTTVMPNKQELKLAVLLNEVEMEKYEELKKKFDELGKERNAIEQKQG